ncbi:hypothetical protein [Amnibacterium kyonggiense]
MNDGLPTEEQLRRIERGVQRRIDRRRRTALRAAQAAVAVVLVVGGFALLRPTGGAPTTSSAGSGAAAASATGAPLVSVVCHGARTTTVRADAAGLPASALAACDAAVARFGPLAADGGSGASPAPHPSVPATAVVCRAADGDLHVFIDGGACRSHGMSPYSG